MFLGVDVGTTHSKAGLFTGDGAALKIASRATPVRYAPDGYAYYDPEELWQTVTTVIAEVTGRTPIPVAAVGIASMAETGLLLDANSGQPRSQFIPWFDQTAAPQAAQLEQVGDAQDRFCTFGIYPSFKCGLAKILWLRQQQEVAGAPSITSGAIWLNVADYVAFRLTGVIATDYTLAGRTYAFNLAEKRWDAQWLDHFDLTPEHFPVPYPSGTLLGQGAIGEWTAIGIPEGTPVAIGGHDHLCAAFAAGAVTPNVVFDSMGTAEAMIGVIPPRPLTAVEYGSGLTFGHHTVRDQYYWLGGSSSSGGSVEWLRSILGDPPLSYDELDQLLAQMPPEPGQILYLPYLSGRGAPWPDTSVRGAFIGLDSSHGRTDLLKAVLEGTSYQMESIRRAAEQTLGLTIDRLVAAGGGARNRPWLQIKADIGGCSIDVPETAEATLLGAALIAAHGAGLWPNDSDRRAAPTKQVAISISPDASKHRTYRHIYQQHFKMLQAPLKTYYQTASSGEINGTN